MKTRFLLMVGVSVLLAGVVNAQETPAPNQGYDLYGTLSVGYRMINVTGSTDADWYNLNAENLFREQYGISSDAGALGNKVPFSLNLFGSKPGVFDQFMLNADFNPAVQGGSLRVRNFGAFDLNVSYKNVNYFFDRYDSLFNDLRRYETNRQDLNATLDIHATDNIGFELGYRAIGHGGKVQLPRPMYLELGTEGPDRVLFNVYRNYYLLETPRTDLSSEFHAAVNADFDMFAITVGGGLTDYTESLELAPVGTPDGLPLNARTRDSLSGYRNQFGIVGDNTNAERLYYFQHNEERELSGPFFFGQAVLTPADIFSLTASFRMESLEGTTEVEIDQEAEIRRQAGTAPNIRRYNMTYRGTYDGEITSTLDRMLVSAAATITPIPELDINAGVKITNHDLESTSEYHGRVDTASFGSSTFKSAIDSVGVAHYEWVSTNKQPVTTIFGNVNFAPMRDLTVTAGVTMINRAPEVNRTEDGVADSIIANNMSKKTASMGLNFGVGYRIMPELSLRARFEMLTREATFSGVAGGPADATVTDLEPRTAPENVTRIGASLNWGIMEGLDAGLRFNMSNAKSDLNESMWITEEFGNPVEFTNDDMTIAASFGYAVNDNTTIRLLGENRSQKMSIPLTWTRGTKLAPIFGRDPNAPPQYQNEVDSASVILTQETNDMYVDLGLNTRVAEALSLGVGFSFLDVSGNPEVTPQGVSLTSSPTRQGDVTRTGGPFSRITINGNVGYDITKQFSVLLDVFYAMQDEKEVDLELTGGTAAPVRFYGLNDYNGLSAALNVVYNF